MSTHQKTGGAIPVNVASALAVPGAGTVILGSIIIGLAAINSISLQTVLAYTSGGTSINLYLQTSLDRGATWFDIMNQTFATANATKLSAVTMFPSTPFPASTVPGDAALTANTVLNGILGDRVRVKAVIVGTYVATISLDVVGKP